ncbi:hypothetical protein CDAR_253571 [Caerostris darwini]|uniref:Uncharacterized protein n=1 Tax=Caerostris darwini TaxID=1538125 RepID=A0AAV4Q7D8_9ARAC|nr:hypothetical protein CDAR_253571 [Caerostris darwini]
MKRRHKKVSSSTTIMGVDMLSVVLLNASPIRAGNYFHIRPILPQKRLPTTTSEKLAGDFDNLVADVKAWVASKNREFFAHGIDRLPKQMGSSY